MSELRGIGLDICDIARMAQQLDNTHFLQRILTKEEIAYLRSRGASAADTLAGLYAAKEAIVKALGCGIAFPLTEIAISHTAQGQPTAALSGEAGVALSGTSAADDYARRGGRGGIRTLFGMKESLLMR